MRVIHVAIGQNRVQDGFHGGRRCGCTGHAGAQGIDHIEIRQTRQLRQFQHRLQAYRCESCGFYRFQVPAAAFYIENIFLLTKYVFLLDFDRGIPTSMQNQVGITPQQARGIDALTE